MKVNYHESYSAPTAYVSKNRQRIKQFYDTVYMNNGDEFEIELYNPTNKKVLAQIELNGKSLRSGIVLRPAERVFLERFFDSNNKFLFETYMVNDNSETKKAIQNNGTVTVKFYGEHIPTWLCKSPYNTVQNPIIGDPFTYETNTSGEVRHTNFFSHTSIANEATFDMMEMNDIPKGILRGDRNKKETGRVEKGSQSEQGFKHDNSTFDAFYSWQTTWKILPLTQKPITSAEIKVYCTSCGTKRRKQSHLFCPSCGTKF